MKTKTTILEINHEDLVDFFSTALYGSRMFGARYDSIEYYELKDANENDCYEDKLARLLLAGKTIEIIDKYAEDADEYYGNLPHVWVWNEYEYEMIYTVSLDDIKRGIQSCLDGDDYLSECARNLVHSDEGNFDSPQAENILQVVLFGEMIYG